MHKKSPHILVVGAGIIGASIAWYLMQRGAAVTIVEAAEPGGVATPNSFSWINSNYSFEQSYFDLRHRSMAEWKQLSHNLPQLPVSFSGSIYLPQHGLDIEAFVDDHSAWGYRISLIDGARVRELEPNLAADVECAAHARDEGAAEAKDVARLLVAAAVEDGAQLLTGAAVEGLDYSGEHVSGVRIKDGSLQADEVIIAAGAATPQLLAETSYDLPLNTPPGLLAHTKPVPQLVNGVILAEGLHIRQKRDGALLVGADFEGSILEDDPASGARELMRRLGALILTNDAFILDRVTTGLRPTPQDGLPVVGRVPGTEGLYIAVMHSGVTLAPAIGLLAAQEILDGKRDPLLAPFGPER